MSDTSSDPTIGIEPAVADRLATVLGADRPPETVAAFVDETLAAVENGPARSLGPDDLCSVDDGPHAATVDGETRHYQCFLDALVLGTMLEDPVRVETETRDTGEAVVVEFDGGDATVVETPADAVLSFGVSRSVESLDGAITPERLYPQVCGYSHVFASREGFEEWAAAEPGAVAQAWPLSRGLAAAERIVAGAAGET